MHFSIWIRGLDFIFNPSCNRDVKNFQERGNQDCQEGNFPYILQVNVLKFRGEEYGGTCIIGTDHQGAINRYREELHVPHNDTIKYKLLQADGEMLLIADLDINRKGVPMPASDFKMKFVSRYLYRDRQWVQC